MQVFTPRAPLTTTRLWAGLLLAALWCSAAAQATEETPVERGPPRAWDAAIGFVVTHGPRTPGSASRDTGLTPGLALRWGRVSLSSCGAFSVRGAEAASGGGLRVELALLAGLVPAEAALGVMAAVALVLYATFLGTDGAVYRLLRQYGTVVYFGCTCLCMLLLGQAVQALARLGGSGLPGWLVRSHVALACMLVALGVANAIVAALLSPEAKARTENVTEWWGALIFVLCFCTLAAMWARCGLRLRLQAG